MKYLYRIIFLCVCVACESAVADIGGRVMERDNGKGLGGAYVYIERIGDELRSLFPDGGGSEECIGARVVKTFDDGYFHVDDVPIFDKKIYINQRYRIMIYYPGYYYEREFFVNGKKYYSDTSDVLLDGAYIQLYLDKTSNYDSCDRLCYISGMRSGMCPIYNESTIEFIGALYSEAAEYGMKDENRIKYMDMCQLTAISLNAHGVDYGFLYRYGCEGHIKNSRVLRSREQGR